MAARPDTEHSTPTGLPVVPARPSRPVLEEEWFAMVQRAAYFLAQERGFEPGHEIEDWARAEAIVATSFEGDQYCGD